MGQIQQILDERYTMLTKHAAVAGLIACAGFVQISAANDSETERAAALERLEQARLAFEAAKAELEAAQRDAAAVTSGSIQSEGEGETESESYLQPEGEADMPEDPNSWTDGWDFKAFVGINGASGNSESLSARASIDGERFTSKYETKVGASYVYGTSDGDKDTSRGEAFINNDWLLDESRWRVFATGKYEYDEFQAWDHRLSASLGLGYEIYEDEDTTLLLGRVGIGAYYEIGDMADEELIPEGVLGLELRHKLSENASLNATSTYFPSFDDLGEFRWNNTAELEVVMDAESGLTLNTGFEHRHDSDPGAGRKSNDILYYMGLGWNF